MKIDKILSGIRQSQEATKEASDATVASAAPATKTAAPRDGLVGALSDALAAAPATKTASAKTSPVDDVMKVAADMAATEQDAQVKQAQVMGAAFADAFVARLGQWQTKAAELNAQAPAVPAGTNYAKLAAENPGMVAQAQNMGYAETKAALEKQAADEQVRGYNDTVEAIYKTASFEFLKGAAVMSDVLDAVTG